MKVRPGPIAEGSEPRFARVLITGGAGFVGSHLAAHLTARGSRVVILDDLSSGRADRIPPGAVHIQGSVTDRTCVDRALEGVEACFHLAAVASIEACRARLVEAHRSNLTGFLTIVEALGRLGGARPLVYASSAAVYGACPDLPLAEHALAAPDSSYGADKLACEIHARAALAMFGLSSVGLRLFNVYGPGQDATSPYAGVIARFAESAAAGRPLTVNGSGAQTRDFVHVSDVVAALIAAAGAQLADGAPRARVLNVCTGRETSVLEVARTMARATRPPLDIVTRPERSGGAQRSLGDPTALALELGIVAGVTLERGLIGLSPSRSGEGTPVSQYS